MRNVKKIAVLLFSAVGIMVFIFSCIKGNLKVSEVGSLKEEYVLPSQELVDDIILPEGTKWRYTSIDKSEVKFSLPDGYIFLLKNLNNNSYLKSDDGGGYSCTCSSTGGCSVVYEQNHGYGCLQSTCKGSCTGKPQLTSDNKPTQMLGVLNSFNDELALSKDVKHRASLSVEGKKAFFELPEVQQIIEKNYAFI